MLFNSLQFVLFFIIITILYWKLPHRFRWFLLLLASCYFYMAFVPVYILILGFTIVIDFVAGIYLEKIKDKRNKKVFLIISLIANIGVLVIFKYYNFFNLNLNRLLSQFGEHSPLPFLYILLPIGLSFHTFQAMSYTIEVYRGNQRAERHFGIYALYVMFYPQLVAGPIERPQNVLPQFHEKKEYDFEKVKSGLMQMAFGMFKKVVIADRLAILVDSVYANPIEKTGLTVFIACIFYAFQIYCDFSGYCDIGIGAARVMGITLMDNFNIPYMSRSISEFWSRWHISLSTWFRDYLYIPLGGNRVSMARRYFNLFFVFLISGLWHGANWTFIIWGAIHGLYLIAGIIKNNLLKKAHLFAKSNLFVNILQVIITFSLVCFAWIFFRSPNMATAKAIIKKLCSVSLNDTINYVSGSAEVVFSFILIAVLLLKEKFMLCIPTKSDSLFYFNFILLIALCYFFGVFNNTQFIYFQF
jgi:alginate O-acetyltransferase complex protein AlgI